MRKYEDLSGQTFNRLTVIDRDFTRKKVSWTCICICGNIKTVRAENLKSGITQSCGCLSRDINSARAEDLLGKKFGKLLVIERAENKNTCTAWKCRCDCGKTKIVLSMSLNNGRTKSCGCLAIQRASEANRIDGINPRINLNNTYLTLLERDFSAQRKSWFCLCRCGKIVSVREDHLDGEHTRSCGCLSVEKAKESMTQHGLYEHRLYKTWVGIKQRCYNKKSKQYNNYGGRGIKLCREWLDNPEKFIEYVSNLENFGKENLSIDRINNNGDYEPGNLRWATAEEQSQNTRSNVVDIVIVKQIRGLKTTKTAKEISDIFDLKYSTVLSILNNKSWKLEYE